jgi:DNA-binding NtrC family response regulator
MQAMLLRFLETGELQRVGADHATRRIDVRIIAATNRNLAARIEAGEFRADLYYRLNVVLLEVPALRERRGDIPELLEHFLELYSLQHRVARRRLTPEALQLLMVKNLVERLAVRAPGDDIRAHDLPEEYRATASAATAHQKAPANATAADVARTLVQRMTETGESFWSVVHAPFIARDLLREQLRAVVRLGLERTSGNYIQVLRLFNLPPTDYKRFLAFLRKYSCHYPVQAFRMPLRSAPAPRAEAGLDKMWVDGHPFEAVGQQSRLGCGSNQAGPDVFHPSRATTGA